MAKTFSAQVDEYIRKYKERMVAVASGSISTVIKNASTPTAKGGRMRVETGFLRASGRMSFSGMPSGPTRAPKDAEPGSFTWSADPVILQLKGMKLGDTIFFGWTAEYAAIREVYDGFLAAELQNWQNIVNEEIMKVKARIG